MQQRAIGLPLRKSRDLPAVLPQRQRLNEVRVLAISKQHGQPAALELLHDLGVEVDADRLHASPAQLLEQAASVATETDDDDLGNG